jgi:hypothetical protein
VAIACGLSFNNDYAHGIIAEDDVVHDVISSHEGILVYKALLFYFYTGKLRIVFTQSAVSRNGR